MEADRVGHHEVRGVAAAALVAIYKGQVQFGRPPFEDHEPHGIAVGEGYRDIPRMSR